MHKLEFIAAFAEKTGVTPHEADKQVNAALDLITETLKSGSEVNISGFGKFSVKARKERNGVNPKTGEKITIAAVNTPKFKAGEALKSAVNGK